MAGCSDFTASLGSRDPSPWLHVNYTLGMVLGVDDLTQEFAYLSNRDQWAVRELHGFGTISGLAIRMEDTPDGPRLHVAPGSASVPSGKLVCVPSEQCALINQWLARPENPEQVPDLIAPSSPMGGAGTLSLYLTLCYADCTTQPVPIPGDPCRSEDQLMADSRVADDYLLELRTSPPEHHEPLALTVYLRWLAEVPVAESSPLASPDAEQETEWADAIRVPVTEWLDTALAGALASPLDSGSDGTPALPAIGSPLQDLTIASDQREAFLGVALRLWITEFRPRVMARTCGAEHLADHDCLLLARLEVPVVQSGEEAGEGWQVSSEDGPVLVDESQRPLLSNWATQAFPAAVSPALAAPPAQPEMPSEALPIVGTVDDIQVTNLPDAIELSLPQPLATGSSPRFAGLTAGRLATRELSLEGRLRQPIRIVTADVTPEPDDACLICRSSGTLTVTLPRANDASRGQTYVIKNASESSAELVFVRASPGNRLDGRPSTSSLRLRRLVAFGFISDGTDNWFRI